jgi:N-acyl-D-amino-acid deacylase
MKSFLIRGGFVYKGGGREDLEKCDIFIKDEKILKIGEGISVKNILKPDEILDVNGCIITPGFIEISESITSPFSILKDKSGGEYIKRGITSVVFGSDGISPTPLYYGSQLFLKKLFSFSETPLNVSWTNTKELYKVLENLSGVNFGFFIGYTTLRSIFSYKRKGDLTLGEIESISRIAKEELKHKALGISFNFKDPYMEDVSLDEVFKVINNLEIKNKVLSLCFKDEKFLEHFERVLDFIYKREINLEISSVEPLLGNEEIYLNFLKRIEESSSSYNIHFDFLASTFGKLKLRSLFVPEFVENKKYIFERGLDFIKENYYLLWRKEIKKVEKISPSFIYILYMPKPLKFLEGKSLQAFMVNHNISTKEEALLKLGLLSNFEGEISLPIFEESILEEFYSHKKSILTINPPLYFEPTKVIFEKILSSGKLVNKLTHLPASKLGILKRGEIKEGNFADLVIFKDNLPYYVFVNGVMVLKEGKLENIVSWGRALETKWEI